MVEWQKTRYTLLYYWKAGALWIGIGLLLWLLLFGCGPPAGPLGAAPMETPHRLRYSGLSEGMRLSRMGGRGPTRRLNNRPNLTTTYFLFFIIW